MLKSCKIKMDKFFYIRYVKYVCIYRVCPTGDMGGRGGAGGESPQSAKNLLIPPLCSSPPPPFPLNSTQQKNKSVIFSCSHCSWTIFVLSLYSLERQIMLILILIGVQYSQYTAFSFEKFLNHQNYFRWKKNKNFILKPR